MTTRPGVRKAVMLVMLAIGVSTSSALAQQTVILVRHAERADAKAGMAPGMATDPDLSAAGRARAEALAAMLKDARITTIISTEYQRTRQTAEPLAKALGVTVTTIKSSEDANVVKTVRSTPGNVLIVGHSNTIPGIVKALGAPAIDAIRDDEYDNLYIVTPGTPPAVVRLHFKP